MPSYIGKAVICTYALSLTAFYNRKIARDYITEKYPGNLDVLFQALDFKFNCIFRRYNVWTWSQWDIFDSSRCWIRMIGVVFPTYILYNSNSFESNYVSKNVRIGLYIFIVNTNTRKVKSYRKHIFDLIPNQLRNRT